jgi:hypothetical protein
VRLRASDLPLPSPYALSSMHGYGGHATDPHALHLSAFRCYAASSLTLQRPSGVCESSTVAHDALNAPGGLAAQRARRPVRRTVHRWRCFDSDAP